MFAILTDARGQSTLGSDGKIWIDGRFGHSRIRETVRNYRKGFEKHFPHYLDQWTHYGIVPNLRHDPKRITPID